LPRISLHVHHIEKPLNKICTFHGLDPLACFRFTINFWNCDWSFYTFS